MFYGAIRKTIEVIPLPLLMARPLLLADLRCFQIANFMINTVIGYTSCMTKYGI